MTKIWPTFIFPRFAAPYTFAKLPVRALINDLKKKLRKKLYVTIPQWSEAFRNMSHLPSGWNRAKCGLQLNDPIGWSKLRLNQPKTNAVSYLENYGGRVIRKLHSTFTNLERSSKFTTTEFELLYYVAYFFKAMNISVMLSLTIWNNLK